jgi:DNA-binding transcriptional regulator YdaS (Cro superfamily)
MVVASQLREELEFSRALSRTLGDNKQLFVEFQADALAPAYERAISGIVKAFLAEAHPELRKLALEHVARSLREFLDVHAKRKVLTMVSESVKQSPMKAQLPSLLERLKKATEERGSKSALAAYLGLPLASISQWLSGDREPGGETTLRLLHWVEQQERQPNALSSAINTAKGKTQVHKSQDEKQTQVRKKR